MLTVFEFIVGETYVGKFHGLNKTGKGPFWAYI